MKEQINDLKFVWNNSLKPAGKITISLGDSEQGKRMRNYFNQRSWKRLFVPNKKYNCAIIELSQFTSFEAYVQTIKGKNSADYFSRRCSKMGYYWKHFNPNEQIDAIYDINTSVGNRQGRTMDASYQQKVNQWPNDKQNSWIGVFDANHNLVSYIWLIFMNELVLMNRILGHVDHLKNNVMYLNNVSAIEYIFATHSSNYLMYDTFGRKQNGLVLFKKRIGFRPYTVNFI
jgi:hypothetical protein